MEGKWTVQEQCGWGWNVYGPGGTPKQIESVDSAHAAQVYCDARNAGKSHADAWRELRKAGGRTRRDD